MIFPMRLRSDASVYAYFTFLGVCAPAEMAMSAMARMTVSLFIIVSFKLACEFSKICLSFITLSLFSSDLEPFVEFKEQE